MVVLTLAVGKRRDCSILSWVAARRALPELPSRKHIIRRLSNGSLQRRQWILSTLTEPEIALARKHAQSFASMTLSLVLGVMAVIGYLVMVLIGQAVIAFSGGDMGLRRCVRNRRWRSCCSDEQVTPSTRPVRCAIAHRIVGWSTILAQNGSQSIGK
jgi:hypothetical protein